jgi:hypothetical protein
MNGKNSGVLPMHTKKVWSEPVITVILLSSAKHGGTLSHDQAPSRS